MKKILRASPKYCSRLVIDINESGIIPKGYTVWWDFDKGSGVLYAKSLGSGKDVQAVKPWFRDVVLFAKGWLRCRLSDESDRSGDAEKDLVSSLAVRADLMRDLGIELEED